MIETQKLIRNQDLLPRLDRLVQCETSADVSFHGSGLVLDARWGRAGLPLLWELWREPFFVFSFCISAPSLPTSCSLALFACVMLLGGWAVNNPDYPVEGRMQDHHQAWMCTLLDGANKTVVKLLALPGEHLCSTCAKRHKWTTLAKLSRNLSTSLQSVSNSPQKLVGCARHRLNTPQAKSIFRPKLVELAPELADFAGDSPNSL